MRDRLRAYEFRMDLQLATRAVREAGQYLSSLSEGVRSVHTDLPHDVKLSGDITSESMILNVLQAESDYAILTEETGVHGERVTGEPYWIVDPIDGTFNFYRGIPLVAISLALWRDNEPLFGVIFDFQHDEIFIGVVGLGAWLNGNPISVSRVKERGEAVLTTGLPVGSVGDEQYVGRLSEMFESFGKIRMMGTAALSMAYLSCGRVDAYAEEEILLWDVAAGIALTRAAGGSVTYSPTDKPHGLVVRGASDARIWER